MQNKNHLHWQYPLRWISLIIVKNIKFYCHLSKNDKIRMYEKSKITMYKHTFFFVYFFRRYTENEKINYTIKDIKRNEFKTKLFSFS